MSGDPGSCSVAGGSLRRLAAGLRSDVHLLQSSYAELADTWAGPTAVAARRRGAAIVDAAQALGAEIDATGAALHQHGVELAALLNQTAAVQAAATAAGYLVTETGVRLAPGLRGEADASAVVAAESERASLDARWADVARRTDLARARLVETLAAATDRIATRSAGLRLG